MKAMQEALARMKEEEERAMREEEERERRLAELEAQRLEQVSQTQHGSSESQIFLEKSGYAIHAI